MDRRTTRRNVLILALCQALAMTSASLMVTVAALVGQMLAVDKTLATLPIAVQFTATMATTIPASLLMKRVGRRAGFSVGALIGATGGGVAILAILAGSFVAFCVAGAALGGALGFALFYRFAAADAANAAFRGKAISLVLTGGVVAAIAGPQLARWTRELLTPAVFAGCFVAIACLWLAALLLLQLVDIPRPSALERRAGGRPLAAIVRQPAFVVAALGAMVGYGVMSLVMTVTPLAMVGHAHVFDDAAFVIQWHVLGMYAPSFVTGHLIARFGVLNILAAGVALIGACVAVNLSGTGLINFWAALVLLGLGWNFLFIGSTTLLTETYRPEERAKTQALNDFLVFGTVALSAFSSGAVHNHFGWSAVNLAVIAPIAAVLLAVLWLRRKRALAAA